MREHAHSAGTPEPRRTGRRRALALALRAAVACALLLAAGACDRASDVEPASPAAGGAERPAAASDPARPRIVCLGDSLTAGLGLDPEEAYPALLEERLREAGFAYEVVNAGVSGDTTAGGLRRLDWSLDGDVRVLIVALGANDGLRGLPVAQMRRNLSAIIERAQARGIAVLLAGMEAPPNVGPAYTREFRTAYRELADTHAVAFVPFLLEGVAGVRPLNQADGVHPTADGQRRMAELLWPALERLVRAQATP